MKHFFTFLSICAIFFSNQLIAQTTYKISFKKSRDSVSRSKGEDRLLYIEIESDNVVDSLKDYELLVNVNDNKTTFPKSQYDIISTVSGHALTELKESGNFIRIIIKKETETESLLRLFLTISIKKKKADTTVADDEKNNKGKIKEIEIDVFSSEKPLVDYRYLGYIGTNFDLVDGIQPKKLFFATNILIPETKRWGLNVGIYGNRTMTQTDSIRNVSFTSQIVKTSSDSVAYYRDSAIKISTVVSDNIGAYFSPLYHIKCFREGNLKIYYAPVIEFIWRRTMIEESFTNNSTYRIDTVGNRFPANIALPLITPLKNKTNLNVYDVYVGIIGFMVKYETEDISIRITSSIGWNYNYIPVTTSNNNNTLNSNFRKQERHFYFGRLWITEPTTGFTLGAEISNYFGSNKIGDEKFTKGQPYYNVTLSKAFNLKNLAAVVKPLTNK